MWVAGIWPLSLLVACFSGAWPYLKLVLMFACWVIPKRLLSIGRREFALVLLDVLGKWSLIDSYIMIIVLVSFHMSISFPIHNSVYIANPVEVNVLVVPLIGFTLFVFSTICSLILSHLIVALHRWAESPDEGIKDKAANDKEALCTHALLAHSKGKRIAFGFLIGTLLIATLAITGAGVYVDSFAFQFKGAAGWFLDQIGETVRFFPLIR